jgi:hypothetical protein
MRFSLDGRIMLKEVWYEDVVFCQLVPQCYVQQFLIY